MVTLFSEFVQALKHLCRYFCVDSSTMKLGLAEPCHIGLFREDNARTGKLAIAYHWSCQGFCEKKICHTTPVTLAKILIRLETNRSRKLKKISKLLVCLALLSRSYYCHSFTRTKFVLLVSLFLL